MANEGVVSEAQGQVQDQPSVPVQGGDSEANAQVQEPSLDQLSPEVRALIEKHAGSLAEQKAEEIRRREQSLRDKMIHEERMRLLREQQERERQRALENMSDEDYGRVLRQQQKQQVEMQRQAQSVFEAARNEALQAVDESVQDPSLRQGLEQRIAQGEFRTWKDFQRGLIDTVAAQKANAEVARMREELKRAALNDATASVANQPRPDVRQGSPARSNSTANLSPEKKISQGFQEAVSRKRRG